MTAMHTFVFGIILLASGTQLTCQETSGRVIDVLGDPIPAALVEVIAEGKTIRKTYADGEGIYMIPKMPTFGANLRISAKGKASTQLQNQGPRTPTVRNATLLDAGEVHGQVTGASGLPVAGVAVIAVYGKDSLHTRTNASGHYVLKPVPLGRMTINVWTGECAAQQELRLRSASTCDLKLPASTAQPRQVRVQGLPAKIEGAYIEVITANMALMPRAGRLPLAGDGTAVVFVNEMTVISPKVPGYVTNPLGRMAIYGTSDLSFSARLHDAHAGRTELKGQLRTERNQAVPDQRLFFCDQSGRMLGTTKADRSGNFKIRLARPAVGRIRIGMPLDRWEFIDEERQLRASFTWVPIYAGNDTIELRVEETGTLNSAVRDAQGTLLALAEITIADPERSYHALVRGACDRSGQLRMALPVDDYEVLAVTPDGKVCTGDAHIRAGNTVDVQWRTVPTGAATGIVVDNNGQPLPGVELFFAAREINNEHRVHAARRQTARVTTDRHGHFRCRGLPPGDWTIVATSEPDFATTDLTIKAHQELSLKIESR